MSTPTAKHVKTTRRQAKTRRSSFSLWLILGSILYTSKPNGKSESVWSRSEVHPMFCQPATSIYGGGITPTGRQLGTG